MKPAKERSDFSHAEEVLALAISAEMDAHQFYLRAADQAKDGKVRATFLALAGDEEGHRLQLKAQYPHLNGKGGVRYRPGTSVLHRYLKKDLDELEAIALSIKAEKEAINFYQASSEKAEDLGLKKLLLSLSEFEDGHRRLLESEYQARLGRPWNDFELALWVRE
ncbi:MAG: ferritin family protein [bacterium]